MIGSLRGMIAERIGNAILLDVGGIGYLIHCPARTLAAAEVGREARFYIYDYVREDARKLFGFGSRDERMFFETLISISGVGPKVALLVLSVGTMEDIHAAVEAGDVGRLTSLPGIGAKTAKKIVLELKGKLVAETDIPQTDRDVADALVALGYPSARVREVVRGLDPSVHGTEERIRLALNALSS